jgi:membrane-bound inhibitor of C-type lysozyme
MTARRPLLLLVPAAALLVLSGCAAAPGADDGGSATAESTVEIPSPAQPMRTVFLCEDGRRAEASFTRDPDQVALAFDGRRLTLPQGVSASGARYTDGLTTFWNKGRSATLVLPDGSSTTCEQTEPAA